MNNIEILEEFIEQYNASYPEEKECVAIYPNQIEAIENLIQENKELKKENEKLIYARNWYFEHFTSQACTPEQLHKILRFDYIPKSKVKEIVELYDNTLQCTRKYNQDLADILCDLKELLEEGE